jgi:hypothetical protein
MATASTKLTGTQGWLAKGGLAKSRPCLVSIAAVITVLVFPPVFGGCWSVYNFFVDAPKIEAFPWADPAKEAFASRLGLSSTLFQTGLILLAGMWGLLLVKKEERAIILDQWPERWLLILATVAFLSSCWSHIRFVQDMSSIAMSASETQMIPE